MGNVFYIDMKKKRANNAGSKARDDIAALCDARGYERLELPRFPTGKSKLYQKIWILFTVATFWIRVEKLVEEGDTVIYQHPAYGNRVTAHFLPRIQKKKGCRFLALIHDLESLRKGIQGFTNISERTRTFSDTELLKKFDGVICHNDKMRAYLQKNGFDPQKLYVLQIFDYLEDGPLHENALKEELSIIVAGNLSSVKCGYIYKICVDGQNAGLKINLFGGNYSDEHDIKNIKYYGSFKPEELTVHLTGKFGLVWDGNSIDACEGNTGEYLKYNNPHKTSLYLSCGIPVVVWNQAALASFITENNVGIAVDNLRSLDKILSSITEQDYQVMCRNTVKIAKRLRSGFYFYNAVDSFLSNN